MNMSNPLNEHQDGRMSLSKIRPTSVTHASAVSRNSLSSSISRFRKDFNEMQSKMRIFGESLQICRCMVDDFDKKLYIMENRLKDLEKRQFAWNESNYSAIIEKNKRISNMTKQEAKVE